MQTGGARFGRMVMPEGERGRAWDTEIQNVVVPRRLRHAVIVKGRVINVAFDLDSRIISGYCCRSRWLVRRVLGGVDGDMLVHGHERWPMRAFHQL